MKYRDPSTGQFNPLHVKVSDTLPIGFIGSYGGTTPPEGWLICDGSAVSRTAYSALFAAIGTTYGAGDGSTTFNLPDYRDRVPVGLDANDSDFNILGKKLGSKSNTYDLTHKHTQGATGSTTLTINQIPSHSHIQRLDYDASYNWQVASVTSGNATGACIAEGTEIRSSKKPIETVEAGGGQGHTHTNPDTANALGNTAISTIQQSIVTNYIIKAYQVVAAPGTVKNEYTESDKHVYSTNYVNDKLAGIIESGSNENGNWIKYSDGTMICYGKYVGNFAIDTLAGSLYRCDPDLTITLPNTFINNEYNVTICGNGTANLGYTTTFTTTSFNCYIISYASREQSTKAFYWQAIGRWK